MKLTRREKILLPSVLIIILSAMFINFLYLPLNQKIQELSTQSNELTSQILDAQTKQLEIESLKQQLEDGSNKIKTDYTDIPGIWDQAELLVIIENLMKQLSDQKSIDFYDVTNTNILQTGEITVAFDTNYKDFQTILKKLEASEYFNTVSGFSIKKIVSAYGENADSKNDLEASMDIRFYASSLLSDYPSEYDFMKGKFGKANIFE